MKRGESRFFLNWQISKDESAALHAARSEADRHKLVESWLTNCNIGKLTQHLSRQAQAFNIILQYL